MKRWKRFSATNAPLACAGLLFFLLWTWLPFAGSSSANSREVLRPALNSNLTCKRLVQRNGSLHIVHDGDANRVQKTVNGVVTRYLVDDRNATGYAQVVEELNGSGQAVRTYTYGLARISQRIAAGVSYYGYDGHGSVRFLTGTDGLVTDTSDYDAYGNMVEQWPANGTPNLYLYAGEQWDPELGMYYLRARYYQPVTGRFWSMDSFEGHQTDPLSLHKYLYCHGNPINGTDPSGHENMGSMMVSASTLGFMAANLAYRAAPALNRVTILVFEATTGNSVFLGGAGAAVAFRQGTRLGGVGLSTWQRVGNTLQSGRKAGTYDELAAVLRRTGDQANHLNQSAAFPRIPHGEGVAVGSYGSAFSRTTDHGKFHEVLERFWSQFRSGSRRNQLPTNGEYNQALQEALETAGHSSDEVNVLVKLAEEARRAFGYFDGPGGLPPRVPNPLNQR